jgi:bifunctional DNA-binding transcriptional regulator/antitoxin component of YhaV-PrlF toxin-antitoxin module
LPSKAKVSMPRRRTQENSVGEIQAGFRRMTSKGQITIPDLIRKRYNITIHTKLEFVPRQEGILLRTAEDEGSFGELAGSASKHWTVNEMLKRLDELRKENV